MSRQLSKIKKWSLNIFHPENWDWKIEKDEKILHENILQITRAPGSLFPSTHRLKEKTKSFSLLCRKMKI